jgi:hypothetical protein
MWLLYLLPRAHVNLRGKYMKCTVIKLIQAGILSCTFIAAFGVNASDTCRDSCATIEQQCVLKAQTQGSEEACVSEDTTCVNKCP